MIGTADVASKNIWIRNLDPEITVLVLNFLNLKMQFKMFSLAIVGVTSKQTNKTFRRTLSTITKSVLFCPQDNDDVGIHKSLLTSLDSYQPNLKHFLPLPIKLSC